jgi:glycosyltransferase involved in cell wall biosynthesis
MSRPPHPERMRAREIRDGVGAGTDDWTLSVIVPVYNEVATVATTIARLRQLPVKVQVVAVDDRSTDGTGALLEALRDAGSVDVLIQRPVNGGKGSAIRDAIPHCTGEFVVIQDADLEYDPDDLPGMLGPMLDGRADAVFGSRFMGGPHRVLYFWHRLGNAVLTLLSNMLTDLNLSDMETGYKLVRTDLLRSLPLRTRRFGIEPELTARLAQAQARIYEVPVSYSGRTYAEGKKIGWRDGIAAFWHIVRANLLPPRAPVYARDTAVVPARRSESAAD